MRKLDKCKSDLRLDQLNSNMGEESRPTFLFVSFGAEQGLTSVDCLRGKTNSSCSDGHSGSGSTLTSRNLLLLKEKMICSIISSYTGLNSGHSGSRRTS